METSKNKPVSSKKNVQLLILAKSKTKKHYQLFLDKIKLSHTAKEGIDSEKLNQLIFTYKFDKTFVAYLYKISVKTLDRYLKNHQQLSPLNSELTLKLFALHEKGNQLFLDNAAFLNWLQKPAYGIGNNIPIDLISTSSGVDLIIEELQRIEYGSLA